MVGVRFKFDTAIFILFLLNHEKGFYIGDDDKNAWNVRVFLVIYLFIEGVERLWTSIFVNFKNKK